MTNTVKEQLNFLNNLVKELQEKNIQTYKIEVLNKYKNLNQDLLRKFLDYTYSFDKTYGVTSKNVEKYKTANPDEMYLDEYDDIFSLFDDLIARKKTGYTAIKAVISNNDENNTIYYVINKDLKSQISTKIINKVLPGCVLEFNVALANKFQDLNMELDFDKGEWIIERKLDGVRCIGMLDKNNNIHFISRQGREFNTLSNLKECVTTLLVKAKEIYGKEYIVDGECCMMNEKGDEDFSAIMQEITMKNHTIEKPMYVTFDLVSRDEFDQKEPAVVKYIDRLKQLEEVVGLVPNEKIKVVENVKETNKQVFEQWQKKVKELNWEGLCIRLKNSVFQAKRSNDLIKVKSFFDEEFIVKDLEIGQMKMLENGVMVEKRCVKSLVIEADDGTKFNCGSGLSTEQRIDWMLHPEKIKGKMICVQYFEKTVDIKTGVPSLRFPTLKYVYSDEQAKGGRQL